MFVKSFQAASVHVDEIVRGRILKVVVNFEMPCTYDVFTCVCNCNGIDSLPVEFFKIYSKKRSCY